MPVHRPDYSQLSQDRKIFFLSSGGRDSTAMILEAHRQGINGIMVCSDTRVSRGGAHEVLERLAEYTGYELVFVQYQGDKTPADILKESFLLLPVAQERLKTSKSSPKNSFPCCYHLKHRPMDQYLADLNKEDIVLIMGLKGGDGALHRRYRLAQIRKLDQFWRQHKKGFLFYYPLRDCTDSDIDMILDEHGFTDVQSSGCSICPIFLVYPNMRKKDPKTWLRSVTFARRLGVEFPEAYQTQLKQFCTEVN